MQAQNTRSYSRFSPGKLGLCLDFETSGSNFGGDSTIDYQGLSFGAIIFNTETFEEVESIYVEMKFDASKYKWSEEAEAIHGMSREYLEENGVDRDEALAELLSLILKYFGPNPGKILFLGHNCQFDIDFTLQLCRDFGMEIVPFHVILDTSSTGYILTGMYKSNDIFETFANISRDKHNALDDARACLTSARVMREIFQAGLTA